MRVFLDANILFSAAKSAGAIRELLGLLERRGYELVADAYVIEEARRNIASKAPAALDELSTLLKRISLTPVVAGHIHESGATSLPSKDRPVLDAAIRSRCDFLMTGDRTHFGPLYGSRVGGVEVVAPAALAARLIRKL